MCLPFVAEEVAAAVGVEKVEAKVTDLTADTVATVVAVETRQRQCSTVLM